MAYITLTKENFDEVVKNSKLPVLVDFWAPWCGPCKMIGPIIEELAEELEGEVVIGKLNIDDERDISVAHGITAIPTLILFKDGEESDKKVGSCGKDELLEFLGK